MKKSVLVFILINLLTAQCIFCGERGKNIISLKVEDIERVIFLYDSVQIFEQSFIK